MNCGWCGAELVGRQQRKYCSPSHALKHHNATREVLRGPANNRYNRGLCFHAGRWIITCRDGTLMLYSRAVMAAELKRLLRPDEIVHHVNGDTSDDRPENLQITDRAEHMRMHHPEIIAAALRARGL